MLFYARQKVTDLLIQLAVNIQGYLALDMIRKNNLELMKGVDRATTTTIAALRTAVIWYKACSVFKPDYFIEYLPDNPWIHQPFELYDSMRPKDIPKR